jgi:hypothetical protein
MAWARTSVCLNALSNGRPMPEIPDTHGDGRRTAAAFGISYALGRGLGTGRTRGSLISLRPVPPSEAARPCPRSEPATCRAGVGGTAKAKGDALADVASYPGAGAQI